MVIKRCSRKLWPCATLKGAIRMTLRAKPKYRGTTTYFQVMAELIKAAEYRGLTTYQDIAVIMGLSITGSYMGRETGYILGEISEDQVLAGRPMLSAVAVGVKGEPGPGFTSFAQQLGLFDGAQSEAEFWKDQRDAVYRTWKRTLPRGSSRRKRT